MTIRQFERAKEIQAEIKNNTELQNCISLRMREVKDLPDLLPMDLFLDTYGHRRVIVLCSEFKELLSTAFNRLKEERSKLQKEFENLGNEEEQ